MKKQLNEELSRINSMMKMISEESFEDTSKPSETIINDVKQTLRYFLNQDNPQADETEVDADGGWFTINGGDDKYVKYYFDVITKSKGSMTMGRDYMDDGDPGYDDEYEPMDFEIIVRDIEVGETTQQDDMWTDKIEYEGSDFTDFMSLSFKNGMSGGQWLSDTFDERILETDIEEEINNINENKKMSKKITITESQLQRLMERKHSYTDNTPEGEMEEQESVGPDSAIINLDDEDNEEEMEEDYEMSEGKKPKFRTTEEIMDGLDMCYDDLADLNHMMEKVTEGINNNDELKSFGERFNMLRSKVVESLQIAKEVRFFANKHFPEYNDSSKEDDQIKIPGFENTIDDLDNALSIRESVESIKTNFKRFL